MACCMRNSDGNDNVENDVFEDKLVRRAFIIKVLAILSVILGFTIIVTLPFAFVSGFREFAAKFWFLMLIAGVVILIIHILMCCCRRFFVTAPCMWIILAIYVLAHSVVVAFISARYAPKLIFMAFTICFAVTVALSLFAAVAPCDFTSCWIFAFVLGIVMLLMGLVMIFFRTRIMLIIYLTLGVLIHSIYVVVDIQMIVGGKNRRLQYDVDEYVLAAMSIYHDIIYLFIYLLQLLGMLDED